jgi:AcrR family transcriptional regulator
MRAGGQATVQELEPRPSRAAGEERSAGHERSVGRERVADIQRARMLAALVEVVSEHGAARLTVSHVVARSGVSRRTFYELFEDGNDCFMVALDREATRIGRAVASAYEQPGPWRARVRAALTVLLELLDDDPDVARLLVVESLAAGPRALAYRERALGPVLAALDEARVESKRGDGPPPLTAASIVGGVLAVLHSSLLAQRPGSEIARTGSERTRAGAPRPAERRRLVELTSSLMSMIVLPYQGQAAAQRELQRPIASRPDLPRERFKSPLGGLDMRLTYRTVRVLSAIARHPACSNRQVGKAAGIDDQGQMSKLLARLQRLGLVDNADAGSARGAPNAWVLTTRGESVMASIDER